MLPNKQKSTSSLLDDIAQFFTGDDQSRKKSVSIDSQVEITSSLNKNLYTPDQQPVDTAIPPSSNYDPFNFVQNNKESKFFNKPTSNQHNQVFSTSLKMQDFGNLGSLNSNQNHNRVHSFQQTYNIQNGEIPNIQPKSATQSTSQPHQSEPLKQICLNQNTFQTKNHAPNVFSNKENQTGIQQNNQSPLKSDIFQSELNKQAQNSIQTLLSEVDFLLGKASNQSLNINKSISIKAQAQKPPIHHNQIQHHQVLQTPTNRNLLGLPVENQHRQSQSISVSDTNSLIQRLLLQEKELQKQEIKLQQQKKNLKKHQTKKQKKREESSEDEESNSASESNSDSQSSNSEDSPVIKKKHSQKSHHTQSSQKEKSHQSKSRKEDPQIKIQNSGAHNQKQNREIDVTQDQNQTQFLISKLVVDNSKSDSRNQSIIVPNQNRPGKIHLEIPQSLQSHSRSYSSLTADQQNYKTQNFNDNKTNAPLHTESKPRERDNQENQKPIISIEKSLKPSMLQQSGQINIRQIDTKTKSIVHLPPPVECQTPNHNSESRHSANLFNIHSQAIQNDNFNDSLNQNSHQESINQSEIVKLKIQETSKTNKNSSHEQNNINSQVFCMVCEEYININKVNDHSKYCGEKKIQYTVNSRNSAKQSKIKSNHQGNNEQNGFSETSDLFVIEDGINKINDKLTQISYLISRKAMRLNQQYQNGLQQITYCENIIKIASYIVEQQDNVNELKRRINQLKQINSELENNLQSNTMHEVLCLSEKLREFSLRKENLLEGTWMPHQEEFTNFMKKNDDYSSIESKHSDNFQSFLSIDQQNLSLKNCPISINYNTQNNIDPRKKQHHIIHQVSQIQQWPPGMVNFQEHRESICRDKKLEYDDVDEFDFKLEDEEVEQHRNINQEQHIHRQNAKDQIQARNPINVTQQREIEPISVKLNEDFNISKEEFNIPDFTQNRFSTNVREINLRNGVPITPVTFVERRQLQARDMKQKFLEIAVQIQLQFDKKHPSHQALLADIYEECIKQNIPVSEWQVFIFHCLDNYKAPYSY